MYTPYPDLILLNTPGNKPKRTRKSKSFKQQHERKQSIAKTKQKSAHKPPPVNQIYFGTFVPSKKIPTRKVSLLPSHELTSLLSQKSTSSKLELPDLRIESSENIAPKTTLDSILDRSSAAKRNIEVNELENRKSIGNTDYQGDLSAFDLSSFDDSLSKKSEKGFVTEESRRLANFLDSLKADQTREVTKEQLQDSLDPKDIDLLFRKYDADHNGSISFEEMSSFVKSKAEKIDLVECMAANLAKKENSHQIEAECTDDTENDNVLSQYMLLPPIKVSTQSSTSTNVMKTSKRRRLNGPKKSPYKKKSREKATTRPLSRISATTFIRDSLAEKHKPEPFSKERMEIGRFRKSMEQSKANLGSLNSTIGDDMKWIQENCGKSVVFYKSKKFCMNWGTRALGKLFQKMINSRVSSAFKQWQTVVEFAKKKDLVEKYFRLKASHKLTNLFTNINYRKMKLAFNSWVIQISSIQMQEIMRYTLMIQTRFRIVLARRKLKTKKKEQAALLIQKEIRTFLRRCKYLRLVAKAQKRMERRCALVIQKHWKFKLKFKKHMAVLQEVSSAVDIQRCFRGFLGRNEYKAALALFVFSESVTIIAAVYRGILCRRQFAKLIYERKLLLALDEAATIIQCTVRMLLAKVRVKQIKKQFLLQVYSEKATIIQRFYRKRSQFLHMAKQIIYNCISDATSIAAKRLSSILLLQCLFSQIKAQTLVASLRRQRKTQMILENTKMRSARIIQTCFRNYLLRCWIGKNVLDILNSSMEIFSKRLNCSITLQCFFRTCAARNRYRQWRRIKEAKLQSEAFITQSSIKIQTFYRKVVKLRLLSRSLVESLLKHSYDIYEQRQRNAITIQCAFRSHLSRVKTDRLKKLRRIRQQLLIIQVKYKWKRFVVKGKLIEKLIKSIILASKRSLFFSAREDVIGQILIQQNANIQVECERKVIQVWMEDYKKRVWQKAETLRASREELEKQRETLNDFCGLWVNSRLDNLIDIMEKQQIKQKNQAATIIQSNVRVMLAKAEYNQKLHLKQADDARILLQTTIILQSHFRSILARRQMKTLLNEKNAATLIQCEIRRKSARRELSILKKQHQELEKQKQAAIIIQAHGRKQVAKKHFSLLKAQQEIQIVAAMMLQKQFRGWKARKSFKQKVILDLGGRKLLMESDDMNKMTDVIISLQSRARMKRSKKECEGLLRDSRLTQKIRALEEKQVKSLYATKLQRTFRKRHSTLQSEISTKSGSKDNAQTEPKTAKVANEIDETKGFDAKLDEDVEWIECWDANSMSTYYYNLKTDESTWEAPPGAIRPPSTPSFGQTLGNDQYHAERRHAMQFQQPQQQIPLAPMMPMAFMYPQQIPMQPYPQYQPNQYNYQQYPQFPAQYDQMYEQNPNNQVWEEYFEDTYGLSYYYNIQTGESRWEPPPGFQSKYSDPSREAPRYY